MWKMAARTRVPLKDCGEHLLIFANPLEHGKYCQVQRTGASECQIRMDVNFNLENKAQTFRTTNTTKTFSKVLSHGLLSYTHGFFLKPREIIFHHQVPGF
jgi:hypothetical protein